MKHSVDSGQWIMDSEQWIMDSGQWKVESGKWKVESGQSAAAPSCLSDPSDLSDSPPAPSWRAVLPHRRAASTLPTADSSESRPYLATTRGRARFSETAAADSTIADSTFPDSIASSVQHSPAEKPSCCLSAASGRENEADAVFRNFRVFCGKKNR